MLQAGLYAYFHIAILSRAIGEGSTPASPLPRHIPCMLWCFAVFDHIALLLNAFSIFQDE
ncbi:hypothetical protein AO984_27840 [Pseudomonas aeruginosa]|nr:hypothetical protein AO984_27840 [Pseudomonas aeruginosa]KSK78069.1 hypothetical protein APA36_04155 [Pseudomonas aeruginosa]OHQ49190.1 hypothetical protein HMPREF2615_18070 [Pseudomonas aeruginosa]